MKRAVGERFETASEHDMWQADGTFSRYRLASLAVIRHAGRDARRAFLPDLWELGRRSFPEMQLIMQLLSHFSPQMVKPSNNAKGPAYEEVLLPGKLKAYTADLSDLGAFFRPNKLMANYVILEMARGKQKAPGIRRISLPT